MKNYKNCLFNDKIILKPQQTLKSDHHNVYTVKNNKIALSSTDDKRFDKTATYPRGTNAFKLCKSEMLKVVKYRDFVSIKTNRICKTIV